MSEADEPPNGKPDGNVQQRARAALDLLSRGYAVEYIQARCGYKTRKIARRAMDIARRHIAEDTAEEQRLNFKASYGPVRVALHERARKGEAKAVEALVKLDERECHLFGLDLTPTDPLLAVHYTKHVIVHDALALPASRATGSEPTP